MARESGHGSSGCLLRLFHSTVTKVSVSPGLIWRLDSGWIGFRSLWLLEEFAPSWVIGLNLAVNRKQLLVFSLEWVLVYQLPSKRNLLVGGHCSLREHNYESDKLSFIGLPSHGSHSWAERRVYWGLRTRSPHAQSEGMRARNKGHLRVSLPHLHSQKSSLWSDRGDHQLSSCIFPRERWHPLWPS